MDSYVTHPLPALEGLTETLALELDSSSIPRVVSPTSESPSQTPRSKPKSKPSSFVSFLSPRKHRPTKSQPSASVKSVTGGLQANRTEASPFGPHYQKTIAIMVEPYSAPPPSDGPWTPAKPRKWSADEEDVFTSGQWGDGGQEPPSQPEEETEQRSKSTTVTLSRLLDNVVILEESIKELVAIIHARRSLGIDSIRYL